MGIQILIGLTLIALSVIVQVGFIEVMARHLRMKFSPELGDHVSFTKFVLTLSLVNIWLLLGLLVAVSLWTFQFLALNVFATLEQSFYFSLVSFTTLGFGDVVPPDRWRILSGFVATNGFLLFGLNTAVLFEVIIRMRRDASD